MIFLLCTQQCFCLPYLTVLSTTVPFPISQTYPLEAQYCELADWFILSDRKLIFPMDTFCMESEGKEQRGERRSQAVYFGCSAFYQLGPCDWFPFRLTTPASSPISDDIKCMYDILLTPHKARNITAPMTKTKKTSRGHNTWKTKPNLF